MRHLLRLHRPRRIASVMLFVWLSAVFVSWANACLVQPSAASADARSQHVQTGVEAGHGVAHDAAGAGRAPGSDPTQQVCASFCETEQRIVAKAQPSKSDAGADAVVLPLAAVDGWPALVSGRAEPRWRPLAAPLPPGPPVAIAFLRLTL
jgi:hypothetical protein